VSKLTVISRKETVKARSDFGFYIHHQKGSHIVRDYKNPGILTKTRALHRAQRPGRMRGRGGAGGAGDGSGGWEVARGAVHGKKQSKDIRKTNPIKPIRIKWENLL